MSDFNPDESARLIAETREDDARMAPAPWQLRYGRPSKIALLEAAEVLAGYRALICNVTTKKQLQRLAALRRVYRRKR